MMRRRWTRRRKSEREKKTKGGKWRREQGKGLMKGLRD